MRILIGECYSQCIVCSLKRIFKLGSFVLRTPSCGCYMSVDKFPIYYGAEWCGLLVKVWSVWLWYCGIWMLSWRLCFWICLWHCVFVG